MNIDEERFNRLELRVAELEKAKDEIASTIKTARRQAVNKDDEEAVIRNGSGKQTSDSVLFALLINGSLTKDGIKKTLTTWGIPFGSWFNGGNFKSRLVDANLIKVDGKNENGETIYSLTARGTQKARKRLEGLKKKDKK